MIKIEIDRRVLIPLLALIAVCASVELFANNTTTPSKPNTFSAGQVIRSSELNADFDALYSELQGNVGTANLLDNAITTVKLFDLNVTEAKLAAAVTLKLEQTGVIKDYIGTTAPSGYVLASGRTLGDASSAATERANADTVDLYTLLYGAFANSEAAVSTGRGASAAADYAAHKTIVLPDLRGRTVFGKDNMGGSTAGRLTAALNFLGTTQGLAGGNQSRSMLQNEIANHHHTVTDPGHTHTLVNIGSTAGVAAGGGSVTALSGGSTASSVTGLTVNVTGSAAAYPMINPGMVLTKIIKL